MQKKMSSFLANEDAPIRLLLEKAQQGDTEALEKIILFFDKEIHYLSLKAKSKGVSKEDAKQTILTEFIELLVKGEI